MPVSRKALTATFAASAASLAVVGAAPAGASGPKITASPRAVMVNAETTVKGRGFPAGSTIQLAECGRTFWMAPAYPCLEGNTETVHADARGRFQASFKVGLCPEGEPTKRPTQRVCYLGELLTGEDTGRLVAPTKLIVSYP
jgi:hypothetical protein